MKPYLFVYGTLRRNHRAAHRLLGHARYIASGSIAGTLYDLGKYPGVHRARRNGRVTGEVYELIGPNVEQQLTKLDRYEGVGFQRSRVLVQLSDGRYHRAWAYLLADEPPTAARVIRTGVYRKSKQTGHAA